MNLRKEFGFFLKKKLKTKRNCKILRGIWVFLWLNLIVMTWLIIKLAMVNLFHCPLRQSISHRHFFGYQTMSSIVRRLRILHLIFSSILVEVDRKLERTVFSRWRIQRQWKWKNTSAWHVSSTARQVGFLKLISAKLCEIWWRFVTS